MKQISVILQLNSKRIRLLGGVTLYSLFTALGACSSSTLMVESTPEGAEVTVIRLNRAALKVGNTPVTLQSLQNPEIFSESFQVRVNKPGYAAETALIPTSALQTMTHLRFALVETKSGEGARPDEQKSLNEISKGVAEAQRLVVKKDFAESRRILKELAERYPGVATLYILIGNTYYLDRDVANALEAYKKAQDLQPNNPETTKIIEKLQGIRKSSLSTTGGGN